jgi:hypothetical protein
MNGADRATVTFRQNYRSDVLKSNNRKTLVMVRVRRPVADPGREKRTDARRAFRSAVLCRRCRRRCPTLKIGSRTCFESIEANRLDEAMTRVDALIREYPNFRLAYLVRGDLLLARARAAADLRQRGKTVPVREDRGPARRGARPAARAARASRRGPPAALGAAAARRAEARA